MDAINFAMVINFLVFVYASAFLMFIEWLCLCNRPLHSGDEVLDSVVLVRIKSATLVMLLSDTALHCQELWLLPAFMTAVGQLGNLHTGSNTCTCVTAQPARQ